MTQKIIAVVNQKGGVGKTTTTVNVAAQLATADKPVLIVDLDPQGNATSGLGIDKDSVSASTYDVLCGDTKLVTAVVPTSTPGLFVLPANANLAGAEVDLVAVAKREFQLRQSLESQDAQQYAYIFIDCPPSLGLLTLNGLTAADTVLIPVQAEYYALEGLGQLLKTFQRVKATLNNQLDMLGVVITMYDKRTSLAEQVQLEIKQYFNDKLFKTLIPRNVRLAEAPSFGQTIFEHDKWSKGARAYKALAREVAKRCS
jgi:chromosome partitioning protein